MDGAAPVRDKLQAVVFTAGVAVYLWVRDRAWSPVLAGILLLAVIAVFRVRRETPASLGLAPRTFAEACRRWRWGLIGAAAALVWAAGARSLSVASWWSGFLYFWWAAVQQLLYQNVVAKPLCRAAASDRSACLAAGVLFALVHLPNPVLAPATLLWGAISCRLFRRVPSVFGLALLQTLLSSALYWLAPAAWHHGFRVGAGYFAAGGA